MDINKIIKMYEKDEIPTTDIGAKVGYSRTTISRWLKKAGVIIKRKGKPTKYKVNKCFFDKLNTPEKYHILGLLYADGYIDKKRKIVRIKLKVDDINYLRKINRCIHPTRKVAIYHTKRYDKPTKDIGCLTITNEHLTKRVSELGCSKQGDYPKWIKNEKNHRAFILGYFEGDGCLCFPKYRKTDVIFDLAGKLNFLRSTQKIIRKYVDVNEAKIRKEKSIYRFSYNGRFAVLRILDWLYKDASFKMERKYKLYKRLQLSLNSL